MYIKIYFEEKPVFLCNEITKELNELLHHPDTIFIDEINSHAIKSLQHEIQKEQFHSGVLWSNDFDKLKKAFFKHFTIIEAAGGIVQNEKKELLFIYRLDKWDLPKGKLEKGENLEECAIREVEEETGATNIKIISKANETYHTYHAYGKHFLKISHWFYMKCPNEQKLTPQVIENITRIEWVKPSNLKVIFENTYPSIKDILAKFIQ
jgi:8-oxo-dGTP pyrophosphatase MutT (NUDIX family)